MERSPTYVVQHLGRGVSPALDDDEDDAVTVQITNFFIDTPAPAPWVEVAEVAELETLDLSEGTLAAAAPSDASRPAAGARLLLAVACLLVCAGGLGLMFAL